MRPHVFHRIFWLFFSLIWLGSSFRSPAQTTIFFDGFEGGATLLGRGWQIFNDPPSSPDEVPPPPTEYSWGIVNSAFGGEGTRGGSNKVYCTALGFGGTTANPTYPESSGVVNMVRTNIDLRNFSNATLSFWYKQKIPTAFETYSDYMKVYIKESIEDGNEYDVFSTEGLDVEIADWTRVTLSLDEYAGTATTGPIEVRFEFIFGAPNDPCLDPDFCDPIVRENDFEGVYLDDVLVTGDDRKNNQPRHDLDGITDLVFQNTNGAVGSWSINPKIVAPSMIFSTNNAGFITTPTNILASLTNFTGFITNVFTNTTKTKATNFTTVVTNVFTNLHIFKTIRRVSSTNDQGQVTAYPQTFGTNHFRGAHRIVNAEGLGISPTWQVAGHADFDQDGLSDLLLQNEKGALSVVYMTKITTNIVINNDSTNTSYEAVWDQTNIVFSTNVLSTKVTGSSANLTTNIVWTAVAVPNFTYSGTNFTHLHTTVTNMFYTNTLQSVAYERMALLRQPSPGWRVASVTDLDNDGKRDFIFQHSDTRTAAWFMDGTNFLRSSLLGNGTTYPGYKLMGVTDMNGDGQKDLIFQQSNGTIQIRRLSGASYLYSTAQELAAAPGSGVTISKDWRVAQLTDYNEDHQVDIVAQHTDGMMAIWHISDVLVGSVMTPRITSSLLLRSGVRVAPGWRGAGPR